MPIQLEAEHLREWMTKIVQQEPFVLITGMVGSGKTTLLQQVMTGVEADTTFLMAEHHRELRVPMQQHVIRCTSSHFLGNNDFMASDIAVIGEILSPEDASAFGKMILSHTRTYATMQASGAEEATEHLIQMMIADDRVSLPEIERVLERKPIFVVHMNRTEIEKIGILVFRP